MLTTLYNSNYINTANKFSFEKIISRFLNIVKKIKKIMYTISYIVKH